MRTLLALVAASILVINNGILDGEIRWQLTLLGCVAIGLLWALGEREERSHHETAAERASRRFAAGRRETPQETLGARHQDLDDPPDE